MDSTKVLREAMTAYEAVYNQDLRVELEEKQAFENWVNSLVEEGYDLSEYTWEDMYEAYITEIGVNFGGQAAVDKVRAKAAAERTSTANINAARTQRFGSGGAPSAGKDKMGNVAKPATAKPQPQMKGLSIGKGGFNVGGKPVSTGVSPIFQRPGAKPPATPAAKPPATPAAKPVATTPTARPAAPAAARPTAAPKPAAAPASKPAPTASAAPAAPKRTFNPLMQKTFGYQTGYAPSQVKGDIKKMAQMGSLKAGFDLFDVVKGHLLGEGYADTEEAALAIMANMSEEWRESIISGEQLQELSNRKLRAYVKKSEKSHQDLNKKWDQGTATYKDKYKSINRERGQERAFKTLDKRSGK